MYCNESGNTIIGVAALRLTADRFVKKSQGPYLQWRRSDCVLILLVILILAFQTSCEEFDDSAPCLANVDCPAQAACVEGACITEPSHCQTIGALADVVETTPQNADRISEIHVTVDRRGAVHYCYDGFLGEQPVSYYGRQISTDVFEEIPIQLESLRSIGCGGLAVTVVDTPYLLSRSASSMLFLQQDGTWGVTELVGLNGIEAQGALQGRNTVVTLTPDFDDGVHVALSIGFDITSQPIYLAHVNRGQHRVLLNGWSEGGDHTFIGHAPQVIQLQEQSRTLLGQLTGFEVALLDGSARIGPTVNGAFARGASNKQGAAYVLYSNQNRVLQLNDLANGEFGNSIQMDILGEIDLTDGQIPWELSVDGGGQAHILIKDATHGSNAVTYRVVDPTKVFQSGLQVINNNIVQSTTYPGMQHMGISVDFCSRATIALITRANAETETTGAIGDGLPVIVVLEGR